MRWWEPDLSGWNLTVLGRLGVVWNLRMPQRDAIDESLAA
jgi:stearoyl-CoA desaturase (delta-9 desaturase)